MSDDEPEWWRMCPPCAEVRHEDCIGGAVWCECWVELLLEAEEMTE